MMNEKLDDKTLDKFKSTIQESMDKINPYMGQFVTELKKLQTPKAKKNLKIGEDDVVFSLIEDGRVMIKFATLDRAEKFYTECDGVEKEKEGFFKKIFKKS